MLGLLGRVIKSPWFWSLVGVIILCAMIWFLLGAIGFGGVYPFEDPLYRLAAILVVVIVYFIFVFVSLIRSQRRNQKIIEECPSPAVSAELRDRLGEWAVAAAQSAWRPLTPWPTLKRAPH